MTELIRGFEISEDLCTIRFKGKADVCSTVGCAYSDRFEGISFSEGAPDVLEVPCFGDPSSIRYTVLKKGETEVAAVASAVFSDNLMRAGEECKESGNGICVVILISARLPQHSAARAMVTATEAVTAVLREFDLGTGCSPFTGSKIQEFVIASPHDSPITLTGTGKHSKLGEFIGRTVMDSVRDSAVANGMRDYPEILFDRLGLGSEKGKSCDPETLILFSSLLHLRDEVVWGFIQEDAAFRAASAMVEGLGKEICGASTITDICKSIEGEMSR